jgi:hypothetical protein
MHNICGCIYLVPFSLFYYVIRMHKIDTIYSKHSSAKITKLNLIYTVNPRYNGHVRFQRFCRYNKSAVVTIYRH